MELPEPTAQAVSLAASWWEDYDSDGNYTHGDGVYVDLYVHKRIAPIRMAFFGDVSEENIRDYRDALEILKVIAPSLDIGFATSIDEVTLPIHFVGNCSVEELGERLHGEGCKYVGSYSFPYRPDDLPEAYETHRGFISHNSSSDRKARRMTRRNAVFHELGHALGLHHNYCGYSQMRSPNSKTTQPTNWGALDLMAIAAINNEAVKRGASYSSDYDEGTKYSHGETLDSMREALGIAADASWEAMRTARQLMCQRVDTGFWAEFAEATEEMDIN